MLKSTPDRIQEAIDDGDIMEVKRLLPKGSGVVTSRTHKSKCEFCGKLAELRPYGPRGEKICFSCGMKDEETTKRQFMGSVFDEQIN